MTTENDHPREYQLPLSVRFAAWTAGLYLAGKIIIATAIIGAAIYAALWLPR